MTANAGQIPWPSPGSSLDHQWADLMTVSGQFLVAVDMARTRRHRGCWMPAGIWPRRSSRRTSSGRWPPRRRCRLSSGTAWRSRCSRLGCPCDSRQSVSQRQWSECLADRPVSAPQGGHVGQGDDSTGTGAASAPLCAGLPPCGMWRNGPLPEPPGGLSFDGLAVWVLSSPTLVPPSARCSPTSCQASAGGGSSRLCSRA